MPVSFHRHLARRLLVGGLVIATVLGSIVLWLDAERLDKNIVAMGVAEARTQAPQLPPDLVSLTAGQRAEFEEKMQRLIAERANARGDHFVVAEVYDLKHDKVGEAVASDADDIEGAIDRSVHHFPPPGKTWYDKHLIGGQFYLQMVIPLSSSDGHHLGWFEGVYHIPRQAALQVALGGLRATILVVVAVLATAALLYPLLAALNSRLVARSRDLLRANLGTLEALGSAIAKRDSDTNAHNYRVTLYAVRLAEAVGVKGDQMRALIKGAFLHDVGKIAIPDAVLLKPGKLDPDEFAIMRTHVAHGLDIVGQFDWLADAAAVVGGHHEKVDGSGYPAGTAGDDIPLLARIFAIADVFDALTSRRPYKEPFPLERALSILDEGAGKHFDAGLVKVFAALAPALHATLSAEDEKTLQRDLRHLVETYFANSELTAAVIRTRFPQPA